MSKKYTKLSSTLKRLLFDRDMKSIDLARAVNLPPPTVHRLVTGKSTRPYQSSLAPIADFFGLSVDQLIGGNVFLDAPAFKMLPDSGKKIIEIPLIEWSDLPHLPTIKPKPKTVVTMNDLSEQCFGITMNDSSMEPQFSKGGILILDPDKQPFDRSYVLVRLDKSCLFVFRQILIDAEYRFLKPLNPDLNTFKMRLLGENDRIIATLVEARQIYNENQGGE